MRLGGRIYEDFSTPQEWVQAARNRGYTAVHWPDQVGTEAATIEDYVAAATDADLVLAEVGAWSNPISPNGATRVTALEKCKTQLAIADRVGVRCCVNIPGSRNPDKFNGPHPDNYAPETFDLIVDSVREIIDAVQPTRTFYCLEMMSSCQPDNPQTYRKLIDAIDRPQFAVHLDPINILNSPSRLANSGAIITEAIELLGPWIRSCHIKDLIQRDGHLVHIDEVIPGVGTVDLGAYLKALASLPEDTPVMIEHLKSEAEYDQAVTHLRDLGAASGIHL